MANGMDFPKKIAILFSDVKREYFPTEAQYLTEKGAGEDAATIAGYVKSLGIEVNLLPGNNELPYLLKKLKPDIALNLVDSVKGFENLSSSIPGLLEILEIPYTGADILGMSLDTNKFVIKKLLEQNGVPTPHFQLFSTPNDPIDSTLRFPLISKLNEIHGAVEITKDAVSDTEKHLRERLKFLITTYKQPVLVEEFIVGREVTAILLEGLNKKVYLAEKVFNKSQTDNKYIFSTFEDQWLKKGSDSFHYNKFTDPVLREYVKKAFDITRMYDYGKFDIRIDQSGRYFFIDTNTNPAFGPKECDVAISVILDLYGITFQEILKRLMLNTLKDAQGKERIPPAGESATP
jgi:D-alanine-D-alanine ligase